MAGLGALIGGPSTDWQSQSVMIELAKRMITIELLVEAIVEATSVTVSTVDPVATTDDGTVNGQMWLNKTAKRWFVWDNENTKWNKIYPPTFK